MASCAKVPHVARIQLLDQLSFRGSSGASQNPTIETIKSRRGADLKVYWGEAFFNADEHEQTWW